MDPRPRDGAYVYGTQGPYFLGVTHYSYGEGFLSDLPPTLPYLLSTPYPQLPRFSYMQQPSYSVQQPSSITLTDWTPIELLRRSPVITPSSEQLLYSFTQDTRQKILSLFTQYKTKDYCCVLEGSAKGRGVLSNSYNPNDRDVGHYKENLQLLVIFTIDCY